MPLALLGGLTPARFLEAHWQKKPLLVRQAIPGFSGLLSREELAALACEPGFHPRLVVERPDDDGSEWELYEGPFESLEPGELPETHCTFLVPGLERRVEGAWELLARFSFLPWARIDDLMVSWARPGGSVGPHVDQYDVFLLQGPGHRRWQIAPPGDFDFVPGQPLQVIADFSPEEEWVLEPGDMLYLPPGYAHHGVAVDECMTYSIGFLAPTRQALVENFLGYLAETLEVEGIYRDPGLRPVSHPGALPGEMIDDAARVLEGITWSRAHVAEFLGRLLTGPKPDLVFAPPDSPLSEGAFRRKLASKGTLSLSRESRMLFLDDAGNGDLGARLVLNGVAFDVARQTFEALAPLADVRALSLPVMLDEEGVELLYAWYLEGWIAV